MTDRETVQFMARAAGMTTEELTHAITVHNQTIADEYDSRDARRIGWLFDRRDILLEEKQVRIDVAR